jgi:hypothetical protein
LTRLEHLQARVYSEKFPAQILEPSGGGHGHFTQRGAMPRACLENGEANTENSRKICTKKQQCPFEASSMPRSKPFAFILLVW